MNDDVAALAAAGFFPAPGGEAVLSGAAARLLEACQRCLGRVLAPFAETTILAPLFLPDGVLADAGYLRHFPHQPFRCDDGPTGGGDERYLAPAACFHLYPTMTGRAMGEGATSALVVARCARREGGAWRFPFRLTGFRMLELVVVGRPDAIARRREGAVAALTAAFAAVGLGGDWAAATDAFFLGADEGARLIQKLKGLKREYAVSADGERVALASVNDHETYFGSRFGLRLDDGEAASSFCAAFGLERLTAYGLLLWGAEPAAWPEELRA